METGDGERCWWAVGWARKAFLTWACMLISQVSQASEPIQSSFTYLGGKTIETT